MRAAAHAGEVAVVFKCALDDVAQCGVGVELPPSYIGHCERVGASCHYCGGHVEVGGFKALHPEHPVAIAAHSVSRAGMI